MRSVHARCPVAAAAKPQVLAACPDFACATLQRVLAPLADVTFVGTLEAAKAVLERRRDFALIVCAVYFDESRMFDLLRFARARFPRVPFLCVRVFDSDVSRVAGHAIEIAAESLGAVDYVDFVELGRTYGRESAEQRLLEKVVRHLAVQQRLSGAP